MAWLERLTVGQFVVLLAVVGVLVFIPAHFGAMRLLGRYGKRAVPVLAAGAAMCCVAVAVLATLAVRS